MFDIDGVDDNKMMLGVVKKASLTVDAGFPGQIIRTGVVKISYDF